jgi:hypothetical protein
MVIDYTVLGDGSSDRCLLPVVRWALCRHDPAGVAANGRMADLRHLGRQPRGLSGRLERTIEFFPATVYFVHRDAEREAPAARIAEVEAAATAAGCDAVPVVPVRMTEAWLLFDEVAIRTAAGNPNGNMSLGLPAVRRLEDLANPKEILFESLRQASGLSGRRLKSFRPHAARSRVADLICDFSPLAVLPAFASFLDRVDELLASL